MSAVSVQQPSLLATVAHELRTPLSALQTASEALDRDFDLLERQQMRSMVSSMYRRVLWLRGLLENLLTSASARDGRLQICRGPLDLRDLVDETRALVEPMLARKQQQLRVRIAKRLPLVAADERRLSQVLVNLVTNASKYSGIRSRIDISIAIRHRQLHVSVADRGPGIPPALARSIFEPYDRGERTDGDGLGIGLSVVKAIVEAHGGTFGVKNRRNGGAVFWFELAPMATIAPVEDIEDSKDERRLG
jgi:two-component system, OmpR family, sensor histidine kinase KdpD